MTITATHLEGVNHGASGADTRAFGTLTMEAGARYVVIVSALQNAAGTWNPATTLAVTDNRATPGSWTVEAVSADPGSTAGGSNPTSLVIAVSDEVASTETLRTITVNFDTGDTVQYLCSRVLMRLVTDGAGPITVVQAAGAVGGTAPALDWASTPSGFLIAAWSPIHNSTATFPAEPAGYAATFTSTATVCAIEVQTADGVSTDPVSFTPTVSGTQFSFHVAGIELTDGSGGSAVTESAADAVAVTDAAVVAVGRARPAADAVSVTDTAAVSVARSRPVADPITLTDEASVAVSRARSAADAVSVADEVTVRVTRRVSIQDVVGVTDDASVSAPSAVARSASDTVSVSDAVSVKVTRRISISDTVAVTDATVVDDGTPEVHTDANHRIVGVDRRHKVVSVTRRHGVVAVYAKEA